MPPAATISAFPLFLAPMAGVTDLIFRQLCKAHGADVLTTEFVSADGILHRNERTQDYIEFDPALERPLGVQLFGGDPANMAEAARAVIDWVRPDFIDLNFGCPVNKVVSKNGGSSLLRDCPLLGKVASAVVDAVAACHPDIPVTGKIRIGWDDKTVNAPQVGRILEDCGIRRLAVHGRTRAQGYSGLANWDVIAATAAAVTIPVIGNGDITSARDVQHRRDTAGVAGVMIGRAAMGAPWLFAQAKAFLATGEIVPDPTPGERWEMVRKHCALAVAKRRRGGERAAMASMRARLMAYTRGMDGGRTLRGQLSHVASLAELDDIAARHLEECARSEITGPVRSRGGSTNAAAVLLAAGGSTRLGTPKQLLQYGGKTLLRRAAESALEAGYKPVLVILGSNAEQLQDELTGLNVHLVVNADWKKGMGTTVRLGIEMLDVFVPGIGATLLTLCDQPLIGPEKLSQLFDAFRRNGSRATLAAAAYDGTVGVPAIFGRAYFNELRALPDDAGAKPVLWRHRASVIEVPLPEAATDIDTREQYESLNQTVP